MSNKSFFEMTRPTLEFPKRPKKLIYKVPMAREVIDENNDRWRWDFLDGKLHWMFLGNHVIIKRRQTSVFPVPKLLKQFYQLPTFLTKP